MASTIAFTECVSLCFYRLDSGNYVSEREIQFRLMDVLQKSRFSGADHSPCPRDSSENGRSSHMHIKFSIFCNCVFINYLFSIIFSI